MVEEQSTYPYMTPEEATARATAGQQAAVFEYANLAQQKEDTKLIEQLDPMGIVGTIVHTLRGEHLDEATEKWVKGEKDEPIMNEQGIKEIRITLQSNVNLSTVFGNIPDDQIRRMVIDLGEDLCFTLGLKYKDFQMDKMYVKIIPKMICRMVFIAMERGEDALTLRLARTMIRTSESTIFSKPTEPEKKFSFNPFKLFK